MAADVPTPDLIAEHAAAAEAAAALTLDYCAFADL